MTEKLNVTYTAQRLDHVRVYVEYKPSNIGVSGYVCHCQELLISGTIQETVVAYHPIATQEIFNVLNERFPGEYEL